MTKAQNEEVLVWLDLETTGLNEISDSILEIGMVIATLNDEVIDECNWVVNPVKRSAQDGTKYQMLAIDKVKTEVDEFVYEMHTKNGLWDEIENTKQTLFHVGQQIPEWMRMNGCDPSKEMFYMAGRGIDRFDRKFLETNRIPLKGLNAAFHYRSLDTSNLFQAFKFAGVDINKDRPKRESTHRALDDCKDAIADWAWFKNTVLNP